MLDGQREKGDTHKNGNMLHTEAVENKKCLYFRSVRIESPESHPLRHITVHRNPRKSATPCAERTFSVSEVQRHPQKSIDRQEARGNFGGKNVAPPHIPNRSAPNARKVHGYRHSRHGVPGKSYKLADGCGLYLAKKNFDGLGYVPSTVPQEMELCLTRLEHLSFPHGTS